MRVAKLTGPALNWAVAVYEGLKPVWDEVKEDFYLVGGDLCFLDEFNPSTNWAQGGPIIERNKIELIWLFDYSCWGGRQVHAGKRYAAYGTTPLIAAMRCYVASKLGDEIDIPEELIK